MRALACAAALMGGACWIARALLEDQPREIAFWAGGALLAIGIFGLGLQAVPRAPRWLQAIVGLGSVALALSLLVTVRAEADPVLVDAVAGGLAGGLFAVLAVVWFGRRERRPRRGNHAR